MSKKTVTSFDELPLVLNVMDVAAVLGISRNTAYELLHSKGFPVVEVGKQYRVPKARFIEWLNQAGMAA